MNWLHHEPTYCVLVVLVGLVGGSGFYALEPHQATWGHTHQERVWKRNLGSWARGRVPFGVCGAGLCSAPRLLPVLPLTLLAPASMASPEVLHGRLLGEDLARNDRGGHREVECQALFTRNV